MQEKDKVLTPEFIERTCWDYRLFVRGFIKHHSPDQHRPKGHIVTVMSVYMAYQDTDTCQFFTQVRYSFTEMLGRDWDKLDPLQVGHIPGANAEARLPELTKLIEEWRGFTDLWCTSIPIGVVYRDQAQNPITLLKPHSLKLLPHLYRMQAQVLRDHPHDILSMRIGGAIRELEGVWSRTLD